MDERCKYLMEVLEKEPADREEKRVHEEYCLENGRLYRKLHEGKRWVVPRAARRQVVLHFHDGLGHLSVGKTLSALLRLYWFPGVRRYVKKFIAACLPCMYNKEPGGKQSGYLHPIEKIAVPFDTVHIDHLGPFVRSKRKNQYLIVIVDAFTKFVFLKAVASTKTQPLLTFLDSVIENFGVPRRIITDRGSCFTSKLFKKYCEDLNIKHVQNATATPRANGQVERYNRTILSSLSATTDDEERWDLNISKVRWGLNSTTNSATGKTPYELLFGYNPRGVSNAFLDNEVMTEMQRDETLSETRANVKAQLDKKQSSQKARFDRHRKSGDSFDVGDRVLVRSTPNCNDGKSKKLLPRYSGPYVIAKKLDHDRYVVEDPIGSSRSQRKYRGVVSVDKMKAFQVEVSSESNEVSDSDEN
ncbi:hypothetical protein NQ315_012903 [Exocentrus adspersus]|nr:hypothetical protein NQ315_012903 [Exocentrus adspersus]